MDGKKSFVFYRSFKQAIDCLPEDQQLSMYRAICEKALDEEEPELSGVCAGMFALIVPVLEANSKKYEYGKKGAEYGKKGGRPKKENSSKNEEVQITPQGLLEITPQGLSEITPNVDIDIDVDVDVDKEEEEEYTSHAHVREKTSHEKILKNPPAADADALQEISDAFMANYVKIGAEATEHIKGLLSGGMDPPVIMLAADRAAQQGKSTWSYARGILRRWEEKGVKTLDDVYKDDRSRTDQQRGEKKSDFYIPRDVMEELRGTPH